MSIFKNFTKRQARSISGWAHMLRYQRESKDFGENHPSYKAVRDQLIYEVEAACCEAAPKELASFN